MTDFGEELKELVSKHMQSAISASLKHDEDEQWSHDVNTMVSELIGNALSIVAYAVRGDDETMTDALEVIFPVMRERARDKTAVARLARKMAEEVDESRPN